MSRTEFSAEVRRHAWARSGGRCEAKDCGIKLKVGHFQFDHIIPDGLGGQATLENCAVLCSAHHSVKTHTVDRPIMQKADNIRTKHLNLTPKRPWSRFRKKMNGQVVARDA